MVSENYNGMRYSQADNYEKNQNQEQILKEKYPNKPPTTVYHMTDNKEENEDDIEETEEEIETKLKLQEAE